MPSTAEAIAARIAALLTGATAAGANVWRDRQDAFTREESPALLIELVDEETTPLGGGHPAIGGTDKNVLRLAVIACVRGDGWQAAADQVRCQAHALIAGDATLRGLVANLRRDRCEWKAASADQPFGYAAQVYAGTTLSRATALDLPPN
jgi:hypothetical protein